MTEAATREDPTIATAPGPRRFTLRQRIVLRMIITAGYKIYPAELEAVIAQRPEVAMVAVAPVPDPEKGELARAYVVLKPGAAADAEDIIALCRKELAAYKVPRAVQFVPDLPKTSTGKIMRRELRKLDVEAALTTRMVAGAEA